VLFGKLDWNNNACLSTKSVRLFMSIEKNIIHKNPFGRSSLRDSDSFHGREHDLKKLLAMLRKNRMILLTGQKSSGKTSLARAGIIPFLRKNGFNAQSGKYWRVAYFVPSGSLFDDFASALALPDVLLFPGQRITPEYVDKMEVSLKSDVLGLSRVYEDHSTIQDYNLLIIIDNLENLFKEDIKDEVKWHFFQSLIYASIYSTHPIYVLLILEEKYKQKLLSFFQTMSVSNTNSGNTPMEFSFNGIGKAPATWLQNNTIPLFGFSQSELCTIIYDNIKKIENEIDVSIEVDSSLAELVAERCYNHEEQLRELQNLMSQIWMLWAQDVQRESKNLPLTNKYFYAATGKKEGKLKVNIEDKSAKPSKEKTAAKEVTPSGGNSPDILGFQDLYNSLGSRDKDVLRYTLRLLLHFDENQNVTVRVINSDLLIKANPFSDADAKRILDLLIEHEFVSVDGNIAKKADLSISQLEEFKGNSTVLHWLEEEEMLISFYRNVCIESIFWNDDNNYEPEISDEEFEYLEKHLESKVINEAWSKLYNDDFDKLMNFIHSRGGNTPKPPSKTKQSSSEPVAEVGITSNKGSGEEPPKKKLVIKPKS